MRFFEINAVATSVERCGEGNDGCKKSKKSAECRVALRSRGGGLTSHKCQAREGNMFIKNTSATIILSFIGAQAFVTYTYHEIKSIHLHSFQAWSLNRVKLNKSVFSCP